MSTAVSTRRRALYHYGATSCRTPYYRRTCQRRQKGQHYRRGTDPGEEGRGTSRLHFRQQGMSHDKRGVRLGLQLGANKVGP
jgi:hypothetical protein